MWEERNEQLYRDIPEGQRERLRAFWWAHPYRALTIGGTPWRYLESGAGARLVLLLPGGYLPAQFWFAVIEELERDCHVIAIDAAARLGQPDPQQAAAGLVGLLDAMGAYGAAIVAHGEAGLAAQLLLQDYPHRVQALALVNSPLLEPRAGTDRLTRAIYWLSERLPWGWLGAALAATLPANSPGTPWTAYARALLRAPTVASSREQSLALRKVVTATQQRAPRNLQALGGWRGRCLVVAASDDWRTASAAPALAERYQAPVRWFAAGGQALPVLYPEALTGALRDLLAAVWDAPDASLDAPYLQAQDRE